MAPVTLLIGTEKPRCNSPRRERKTCFQERGTQASLMLQEGGFSFLTDKSASKKEASRPQPLLNVSVSVPSANSLPGKVGGEVNIRAHWNTHELLCSIF